MSVNENGPGRQASVGQMQKKNLHVIVLEWVQK